MQYLLVFFRTIQYPSYIRNVVSTHVTMKRTFDSSERILFEIGLETHWNASAEDRRDVFLKIFVG